MSPYWKQRRFWVMFVLCWLVLATILSVVAAIAGSHSLSGTSAVVFGIVLHAGALCLAWLIARRNILSDAT